MNNVITEQQTSEVKKLYETTLLTHQQIADAVGVSYKQVWRVVDKNYTLEVRKERKHKTYSASKIGAKNPMLGLTRDKHHGYKGIIDDGDGYNMILRPEWYTGKDKRKHTVYHRVVMCQALGITELPEGYVIHHCDKNKKNNSLDNLILMTPSEHSAFHSYLKHTVGATTMDKSSTAKWLEARRLSNKQSEVPVTTTESTTEHDMV